MAWIDASAAAFAVQVCDTPRMVTVSIDKCIFKRPARQGQLLKIYGEVTTIGNTSVMLRIEAQSHSVYSGKQTVILDTNIKFVRIDEEGHPLQISDKVKNKYATQEKTTKPRLR